MIESRVQQLFESRLAEARGMVSTPDGAVSVASSNDIRQPLMKNTFSNANQVDSKSSPEIAQVAFKPPQPLYAQNPVVWFEILEQQFSVAHITREATRYSHAVSALDARLHDQFAGLIMGDKGATPYSKFKQDVIKVLGESDKTKLHNLLHGLTLGDAKPSQLLAKFRLNAGGKFGDDSIRQLWMQRLPQQVQLVLSPFENDLSLTLLAERADNLMETLSQRQIYSVQADHNTPIASSTSDLDEKWARFESRIANQVSALMEINRQSRSVSSDRTSKNQSRSNSREPKQNKDECYYHRRFGDRANKCVFGCKHHAVFITQADSQPVSKK